LSIAVSTRAQETQKSGSFGNPIRVSVDRVTVGVTVVGARGNFITGLRREDFHIYDNGVAQEVTGFFPIEEPAQVVLLMESGPAAIFLRPSAIQAAEAFLGSIASTDRVAVVSYSKIPSLELDFTTDKSQAKEALRNLNFMSGFAQLNLLSSVLSTMDWLSTLPGKKTIVLVSTGLNDSTPTDWQAIERHLDVSEIHILAISIAGALRNPASEKKLSAHDHDERNYVKSGFDQADQLLRQLAGATGGRVYFPKNSKEFNDAYSEIAQFIRNEYRLEFVPRSADGQLHSLKVKVRPPWYHVNYRQAYLAPGPAS
jgi:Ca-activated chloride channel family protein